MNPQAPSPDPTLAPADMVDSAHPAVVEFAARATGASERERAVSLYYLVRDSFRYDAYDIDLTPDGMRASSVISKGHGWCVTKAALLAASARAIGIPARLGFADVRNHLSTQRLRDTLGTDLFVWHGYAHLWLDGRWIKATPAFNIELCDRFRLLPLDWDGVNDSIYHPFDAQGQRHMEYVHDHGTFDDVPLDAIVRGFAAAYPRWSRIDAEGEFERDVERETAPLAGAAPPSKRHG